MAVGLPPRGCSCPVSKLAIQLSHCPGSAVALESAQRMTAPPQPSLPPTPLPPPSRWADVAVVLFSVSVVLAISPFCGNARWPEDLLLVFAGVASVAALARQLPAPNVLMAAAVAAGIGGLAHAVNAVIGLPFGRFEFNTAFGPRLLGILPLAMPVIWLAVALVARGLARLLLHSSRRHPRHGWRVLGLATVLMMGFSFALEPFGAVKDWWMPNPTPLLNVASWGGLGLMVQIAMTPLLLDKFPGPRPPNYHPLIVWAGLNGVVAMTLLGANAGVAGALAGLNVGVPPVLVWWGARRRADLAPNPATPDSTRAA
jgi:uncharacterized membrane protein